MTTSIIISSITCNSTSERGHDELYLKYSVDGSRETRYPGDGYHSIAAGETWDNINLPLTFKTSAVVELYDRDPAGDDFLGSATYLPSSAQPEMISVTNTNGANYSVNSVAG